jgi:response regulator RpfG family c-di-GMP phosphodiesterase
MQAVNLPTDIPDEEAFQDFRDALSDYAPHIEALVAALKRQPDDMAKVADLFRTFHNIKGDAGLCRLTFLIPFVHAAETLLSRVRDGALPFSCPLADVLLLVADRLQLMMERLSRLEPVDALRLPEFTAGLESMHAMSQQELDAACLRMIDAISGMGPRAGEQQLVTTIESTPKALSGDLAFFRTLALQLEHRSALFEGRTERNIQLALQTNRFAGGWVDADQLCAAVCVHDIGMMFLPEGSWIGSERISDGERQNIKEHVGWAAGLLSRMPGWEEAARMVLQHHEKPDGSGYPHGLGGGEIVAGAKILALVDAFESVMVKQGARGQARSILRAVAEVNASDRQFDKSWVEPFNHAIRQMLETHA